MSLWFLWILSCPSPPLHDQSSSGILSSCLLAFGLLHCTSLTPLGMYTVHASPKTLEKFSSNMSLFYSRVFPPPPSLPNFTPFLLFYWNMEALAFSLLVLPLNSWLLFLSEQCLPKNPILYNMLYLLSCGLAAIVTCPTHADWVGSWQELQKPAASSTINVGQDLLRAQLWWFTCLVTSCPHSPYRFQFFTTFLKLSNLSYPLSLNRWPQVIPQQRQSHQKDALLLPANRHTGQWKCLFPHSCSPEY